MSGTTDFQPWATTGANPIVLALAAYLASSQLQSGFPAGIVDQNMMNRVLRQATFPGASIAQFMANILGVNIADDGNQTEFIANFEAAIKQFLAGSIGTCVAAGSVNAWTGTIAGLPTTGGDAALTDLTTIGVRFPLVNTIQGPTFNLNGLGAASIYSTDAATQLPAFGLPIEAILRWNTSLGGWVCLNASSGKGYTTLATASMVGLAAVPFTNISSIYSELVVELSGMSVSGSPTNLQALISTNNGSSYTGGAGGPPVNTNFFSARYAFQGYAAPMGEIISGATLFNQTSYDGKDDGWYTFTGSISGTTLTVGSGSPTLKVGSLITWVGNSAPLTILSGSGTTWTLSASATVSSTTIGYASPVSVAQNSTFFSGRQLTLQNAPVNAVQIGLYGGSSPTFTSGQATLRAR